MGAKRYPKLCDWVEANIEETLTFYRLPRQHHKNLKSTNMLERLNEEIKRRTLGGADLPEYGRLPAAGASAGGRDARELDRSDPVPEYGISEGAQEGASEAGTRSMKTTNSELTSRIRASRQAARRQRVASARTVLARKGSLRRAENGAPLPAPRRSGQAKYATGGSGGNTYTVCCPLPICRT